MICKDNNGKILNIGDETTLNFAGITTCGNCGKTLNTKVKAVYKGYASWARFPEGYGYEIVPSFTHGCGKAIDFFVQPVTIGMG